MYFPSDIDFLIIELLKDQYPTMLALPKLVTSISIFFKSSAELSPLPLPKLFPIP